MYVIQITKINDEAEQKTLYHQKFNYLDMALVVDYLNDKLEDDYPKEKKDSNNPENYKFKDDEKEIEAIHPDPPKPQE